MRAPWEGTAEADFFRALGEQGTNELRARGVVRRFERGVALFHERQMPDRVVALLEGRVKLSVVSEEGHELILALRGPGEVIGELSAIDDSPRCATAVAIEPVEALVFSAADFVSFLEQKPSAALALVRILVRRLREADRMRLEFATRDSAGRVAARLMELCEQFGQPDGTAVRIDLSLSQEELAAWTACSREAVSKALQTMRKMGWIETRRRGITVLDPDSVRSRSLVTA
jgi:CRP/FNR family transcriptional regulator, cyclic AMP receptor protein